MRKKLNRTLLAVLACYLVLSGQVLAGPLTWNEQDVKAHCVGEWQNDFSMQAYCVKQNKAGFDGYSSLIVDNSDGELKPSFVACEAEWGIEWDMVEYCAKQQINGKSEIAQKLSGLPVEVSSVIESQCRSEWGSDFSMVAYCADQNATGWRDLND